MKEKSSLPERWYEPAGRVEVVEADPGPGRRGWLEEQLQKAGRCGARTWLLPCRFDVGGPWAGVRELFASRVEEIGAARPDLLRRHDYELVHVLPELRRSLAVRHATLTDLASPEEKVRNYPADRAFRIVHGLIDLLDESQSAAGEVWAIACDGFDHAGHIGRRFFRELLRRRGEKLRIALVVAVDPGRGEEVRGGFGPRAYRPVHRLDLPSEPAAPVERAAAARQAEELEAKVGTDVLESEIHLAELIRLWRSAGRPEKTAGWELRGLEVYNTFGLYEDAIAYGEAARAFYRARGPVPGEVRWHLFIKLFMSYVAVERTEVARRLAEEDVIGRLTNLELNARLSYLLAMLHARYLPNRDLARGEKLLEQGLELLQLADLPAAELHFQSVFNRNGLAMIRHFQGRFAEAAELCRQGYAELQAHLGPERHRLHRSVLLYNMAQVYSALGRWEEAVEHLTWAMEMDPNYSEYYNDRGNVFLKLGRLGEARADYLRAVELSPPYFEVYTNLGQCCRLMGELPAAVQAYTVALDLEPDRTLALVGRAQCLDALGEVAGAIADYSAALDLEPHQWEVLASRAVAFYTCGDLLAALDDLDRAIELAPDQADLYQNRAVARLDLGRTAEAARDLEVCLRLSPGGEDREELAARLAHLRNGLAAPYAGTAAAEAAGSR